MRPPHRLGLALGVALGGVLLGTLLGTAADPKMKNLPEAPWHGTLPEPAGTELAYASEDVAIYELSRYPDRYPPAFADDEAVAEWAPDYPDWTYSDFGSDLGSDLGSDFGDEPVQPLSDERAAEPGPRSPAAPEVPPSEPPGEGSLAALY